MAMLITKFNKLIANKFVWIGFTILIVVAFIAWDMAVPEDGDPAARQAAGHLFGKPVSPDEFRRAYTHALLSVTLAVGQNIRITEEVDKELNDLAWKRLASLKQAEKMGIRTTDREVVSAIHNYPGFHHQNQFNPDMYRSFVYQYLPSLGFGANQFEEHVRQELVLQKLQRMVAESILVSPDEIQRTVHSFGDEFTVEYVLVNDEVLGEGLDVTDEEVRAFYETNKEAFTIPPKVRVKFVRFPIARYRDDIEITETQALDYYDLNIEEFTRYEDEPAEGFTDDEDLFQVATTIPFEDVQEEIKDRLRREVAARRAADDAMDLVIALVPDRDGVAASFEEAAEKHDLPIEYTEPFTRDEVPEGIDANLRFSAAAFDLRPHPEYYFSDAVEGDDYMYVLALDERFPAYVPEFEEVEEAVRVAAQRDGVERAVEDLAETFRETAAQELQTGTRFAEVAETFALPLGGPITFTASAGLDDLEYGMEILRAVLAYNQGEVTAPVYMGDAYIVAHLVQRERADALQFADFRPQIVATLISERARILFDEWQEHLLKKADFRPRVIPERVPDEDDDYYDDDWVMAE